MKIEYVIRNLKLYEPLACHGLEVEKGGTLYICRTNATPQNSVPADGIYIEFDSECSEKLTEEKSFVPEGDYLFVQGVLFPEDKGFPLTQEVLDAAEQLWLEYLWTEKKPASNTIYLRVLKEEHGHVFQLMRSVINDELES